jgi:hypothetical protein
LIGLRYEPPTMLDLWQRRHFLDRERLRRCLSIAEELELARIQCQLDQIAAPVLAAMEQAEVTG